MPSAPAWKGGTRISPVLPQHFRISVLALGILGLGACSGDSPSEPPAKDPPPTLPTDTTQTSTRTIGVAGGTVSLADGTRIVFPEGALTAPTAVKLARMDPAQYFDPTSELNRSVISTTAPVSQFAREVEILIPLSAGMTEADSSSVLAGRIDPASGAVIVVPSAIRMEGGRAYAVIETKHFSSWSAEWLFGKKPPPAAEPVVVPYYNQGATEYCWAVSLHMVMQAVNPRRMTLVTEVIGKVGVNEGGLTALAWRTSPTIAGVVHSHTGVRPDRKQFDFVNMNLALDYIRREVGINRRPVAVHSTTLRGGHAVVVVGYDGSTLLVSDPASVTVDAVGYTPLAWNDLTGGLGHNLTLLSIPAPVGAGAAPISINFPRDAFRIIRPATPPAIPQTVFFSFRWDHTSAAGHSFRDPTEEIDNPAPPDLPGGVLELRTASGIEISNSSRTSSRNVSVMVRVLAPDAPEGHPSFSWSENLVLPPNSLRVVLPPSVWIDSIRHNTQAPTRYVYDVSILDGTEVVDRQGVEFSIEGLVPMISSMTPQSGGVGGTITLTGERFGHSARGSTVLFNGVPATEIVSWSDTEVRVRVPQGAGTGPVVVMHGEVASNAVSFTVTLEATVGGPLPTVTFPTHQVEFTWSGTWSMSGVKAVIDREYGPGAYGLLKTRGTQAQLVVSIETDFAPTTVEVVRSNGWRDVYEYLEPLLFMSADKGSHGGDFDLSITESGLERTFTFTMTNLNQLLSVRLTPQVRFTWTTYLPNGTIVQESTHINNAPGWMADFMIQAEHPDAD